MNDPFWNQVLSSDDELFDVEVATVRNDGAGPSSAGGHTSSGADGGGDDGGDDSGDSFFSADGGDDGGTNGDDGGDDGGDPGPSEIPRDPSKGKQPITEECISDAAPFVGDEDISLASEFGLDSPLRSKLPQPTQSVHFSLYAARSAHHSAGQSRKNKRKKSRATFSQAAGSVLQENEMVPVEILATQTQTPICGQNEENVLSQPPAARTRSGGKTAKIIPPPPAAPRTIPQPAAPQTPVTEVASQPTVAVTERRKSRPMSASQPLSSIGSRVHRRSGRLAEQVGRKSVARQVMEIGRRILLLWRTLLATTK
ncbi:hypothetical protein CJ030_MR1G022248 [Morella rubra]|uniref:Uncharacterized protein n=1 Tax=Morella rubra TaxID=262757 RepID=A0A6A1WQP3_9ROSI|nr:hypothetical protein CJ030_MR1G022248 [Morella rubra]